MIKFCPLASGSSGNCTYIGIGDTHLLIDAGLSGRAIEKSLNSIGLSCNIISAILITHDHSDHVKGAGILSRRHNIPIFATQKTLRNMTESYLGSVENTYVVKSGQVFGFNGVNILPFEIPHDSCEPVGYALYGEDKKVCVATDIGHINDLIVENLSDSHIILLESNHDGEMLKNGPYPAHLKRRVAGKRGHLSNNEAGELLSTIFSDKLRHVYLGHLSHENNLPLLAMDTVVRTLEKNGIHISGCEFRIAERYFASEMAVI